FLDYHLTENNFTVKIGAPGEVTLHPPSVGEDWQVTLVETGLESMTGCRVKRIGKYIEDGRFLMTYGDGVPVVAVGEVVRCHKGRGKLGTVTPVRQPGRFGELEHDGDQVTEFSEKPPATSGYINGGFFVFERALFDRLEDDVHLVFEQQPLKALARDGELM